MHDGPGQLARLLRPLLWPVAALGVLLAFNAIATPGFFSIDVRDGRLYGVPIDILNHASRIAIVAIGMSLVIGTGGVDLSVGAIAAIAGAVMATLITKFQVHWSAGVLGAIGASLLCGMWNGALVVGLRLQPIVATLILMVAGRGIAQLVTDGVIVTFENSGGVTIGNGAFLGVPLPVWIALACLVLLGALTRGSALGLFIQAVGDNAAAGRLAGLPDRRIRLFAYASCGVCAGIAGIIESSYIKAADANNTGMLLELDAILAAVIGGTALTGGRFSLLGAVAGAVLMQTFTKTLYMQDVSAEIAPAPKALCVLGVCLLQSPVVRAKCARWFLARGAAP